MSAVACLAAHPKQIMQLFKTKQIADDGRYEARCALGKLGTPEVHFISTQASCEAWAVYHNYDLFRKLVDTI